MGRKARTKQERRSGAGVMAASPARFDRWIVAALVALVAAVYAQVATHSFLNYDDPQFITQNAQVLQGLKPPTVSWALTSTALGWYPLTWMSHMLDVELWGVNAGAHLLVNALLHAITSVLLFLALRRMTAPSGQPAATWASGFVAAMFAIHPMHVESVAWISERKDTLSTLFAVLALLLYAGDPSRVRRVAAAMALSLLAKQMYVTLPFLLLLLDFWPLRRIAAPRDFLQRIFEKWPLFLLTIGGSVAAVLGQLKLTTIQPYLVFPLGFRLANGAVAYVAYLTKLIVPIRLALPYPLLPVSALAGVEAATVLIAITAGAIAFRTRAPWLFTGWFWFVGTLVPVIGIVTIGAQSMADRYSYFSSVGLFTAIAFTAVSVAESTKELRKRAVRSAFAIASIIVVALHAAIAFHQVGLWRNSESLFAHSVAVTGPNPMAEYSLGQALELTRPDEAIPHLQRAIQILENDRLTRSIRPPDWYAQAYVGLATARLAIAQAEVAGAARTQRISSAIAELQRALTIDPRAPHAMNNLTFALALQAQGGGANRADSSKQ